MPERGCSVRHCSIRILPAGSEEAGGRWQQWVWRITSWALGSKEDLCLLIAGLMFNSNASEKPPFGIWAIETRKSDGYIIPDHCSGSQRS